MGLLGVGLGIGGALASTPGTASANVSDWLSSLAGSLGPLSAASALPNLNLAISYNGVVLYQSGTAEAVSGKGDFAIANGAGSYAEATGTGDYSAVHGIDSTAISGGDGSSGNSAFVYGDHSYAWAGGTADNPGTSDYAMIWGDNNTALAGSSATAPGSYDVAYVEGNNLGTSDATGGNYLTDILKFYGDGPSSSSSAAAESSHPFLDLLSGGAASDSSHPFLDLLSGAGAAGDSVHPLLDLLSGVDASGALADGGGIWADLLSSFDGGSLAADASNFWTELVSLF